MRWLFKVRHRPSNKGVKLRLLTLCLLCMVTTPAHANLEQEESTAFYEKAVEHAQRGNLRAAVIELKNALQRDRSNAEARLLLGEVYLQLGDGASAEKELRTAGRQGVPPERTVVQLGKALLLQARFDSVLSDFDVTSYGPAIVFEFDLLRADALAGLGRLAEARALLEETMREGDDDARIPLGLARIYMAEGKLDAVEAHATAALALQQRLPEATLLRAEAKRQKGQLEDAEVLYRDILAAQSLSLPMSIAIRSRTGLAATLIGLQRDTEAEKELSAVESVVRNLPAAAYLKALIKVRAQDFRAARNILDDAATRLDDFPPAQFLRGVTYFAIGQPETARSWLSRYLHSYPRHLPTRKLLGATLLRLNAIPDALAVLEPGLTQAPEDPQLLMLLGNAYIRSGRAAEAAELLERAGELSAQDPRVLTRLVVSHLAAGKPEEALTTLNATLDLGADASGIGYALAFVHLRTGAFDEALEVAQSLRGRFPDSALAASLEAGAYAALGQLDDARSSFEAVLQLAPDFHEARSNLAAIKVRQGDLDGAETEYLKIVATDAGNSKALMGLAGLAQRRGDREAARLWLEKVVASDPQSVTAGLALAQHFAATGDFPASIGTLETLARQHPTNSKVLLALGNMQGNANRHADAISTYERLIEATDGATDARLLLARAFVAGGEAEKAHEVLEAALAANADHRPTAEAIVLLVSRLKGSEAALAYAEQLSERHPDADWGAQLIGDQHWRAGRVEAALASYERGWSKRPSASLAIVLSRARLQLAAQQQEPEAPLIPLRQWLDQHPGDDSVRLVLAEGLLNLGELEQARTEYEALRESQKENPVVWNNLAWLSHQVGDPRAAAYGERALELAPDQPAVLDTLGWILLDAGDVKRSADLLEQAHLASPGSPEIAYHYGLALHTNGDDAAARKVLLALLESERSFAGRADAEKLLRKLSR